jgi:Ca-activated chloride channel family protein
MKNVKLISLAFSMLVCFVVKAQEKPVSKEHEKKSSEIETKPFIKSKDTIPAKKTVICAISRPLSNEPLTILDGVLIDSKKFSKVNPNDIESIKVLKGIDATSIYGSRAVNGVIIITSKRKE